MLYSLLFALVFAGPASTQESTRFQACLMSYPPTKSSAPIRGSKSMAASTRPTGSAPHPSPL